MRKTFKLALITLAALLTLTACSSGVITTVTDGDEIIADIKGNTITKNDIYEYSKLRFGVNLIQSNLISMQMEELVELTEEDEKVAQAKLAEAKESLGESFEALLKASGYADEEDYYNRLILQNIRADKMLDLYLSENMESITTQLSSRKIKQADFKNKAEAEAALEELKEVETLDSKTFEEIINKHLPEADEDKINAPSKVEHIYNGRESNTYYNTQLKDTKPNDLSEVVMINDGFAIIYIEELDIEADKDLIKASILADEKVGSIVTRAMYAHYSAKGNFEIHDSQLHDLWKENNPFIAK